jgi:hypothetical protein
VDGGGEASSRGRKVVKEELLGSFGVEEAI